MDLIKLDISNVPLFKKKKKNYVDTILVVRENNAKYSEMKVKYQLYLKMVFFLLLASVSNIALGV